MAHWPTKEIGRELNFLIFPAHGKNVPRWAQMGPGGFFPTNSNLADILGRTDFDFENFYFWDFLGSQISGLGPAWAHVGPAWAHPLGPGLGPPTWAQLGPTNMDPAWAPPLGPGWGPPTWARLGPRSAMIMCSPSITLPMPPQAGYCFFFWGGDGHEFDFSHFDFLPFFTRSLSLPLPNSNPTMLPNRRPNSGLVLQRI